MANYCDGNIFIRGKTENVKEFIEVFCATYDDRGGWSYSPHLFGIFNPEVISLENYDNGISIANIEFVCKFSIENCMLNFSFKSDLSNGSLGSYYHMHKYNHPEDDSATTIQIESRRLGLDIEVFAFSFADEFVEHIFISNGIIAYYKDYHYGAIDLNEYKTVKEYNTTCENANDTRVLLSNKEFKYIKKNCCGVYSPPLPIEFKTNMNNHNLKLMCYSPDLKKNIYGLIEN